MTNEPEQRHGFRVTVEDLETGDKQAMIVHSGDYMLIPFEPCHLHHTQRSIDGTVQLTIRNHRPQVQARQVEPR